MNRRVPDSNWRKGRLDSTCAPEALPNGSPRCFVGSDESRLLRLLQPKATVDCLVCHLTRQPYETQSGSVYLSKTFILLQLVKLTLYSFLAFLFTTCFSDEPTHQRHIISECLQVTSLLHLGSPHLFSNVRQSCQVKNIQKMMFAHVWTTPICTKVPLKSLVKNLLPIRLLPSQNSPSQPLRVLPPAEHAAVPHLHQAFRSGVHNGTPHQTSQRRTKGWCNDGWWWLSSWLFDCSYFHTLRRSELRYFFCTSLGPNLHSEQTLYALPLAAPLS